MSVKGQKTARNCRGACGTIEMTGATGPVDERRIS
jgi:hypothetical protein